VKTRFPLWLTFSVLAMLMNGVWGALAELPEKRFSPPVPATLGYILWSLAFIPCALYILHRVNWKLEYSWRSIRDGMTIGMTGTVGTVALFAALRLGPAYIVFPVISVYPVVTILLSIFILKERTHQLANAGIAIAIAAIFLLSLQPSGNGDTSGLLWLILSLAAFILFGFQGFYAKVAMNSMTTESIFVYMTISNLLIIPLALHATDFTQPVGWGAGMFLVLGIHLLNSVGALLAMYSIRYGKVIIVSPIAAMAPMITTVVSLIIYARVPYYLNGIGIILATAAIYLVTYGELLNEKLKEKII
jgi:drug/metabolite transporter (DMT)-like permease